MDEDGNFARDDYRWKRRCMSPVLFVREMLESVEPAVNAVCSKQSGFVPELLSIIADGTVPEPVRQSAAIFFKMSISRYWEVLGDDSDSEEDVAEQRCLSDDDKNFVKANILNTICEATEASRIQLAIAIQNILRMDYPDKWPGFMDHLSTKISNPANASVLSAGLIVLYTVAKVYEFKRSKEKEAIAGPISKIEPLVFYHCNQMLNNQSAEAVIIKKQGLKIIYVLTQVGCMCYYLSRMRSIF
ncbi:Importin-beta protein, partial [Cooperia oncophora]